MQLIHHNMNFSNEAGVYIPAFFEMHIDTCSEIDKMSKRDFCIFYHEYIHFLQDITTYYCLHNTYCYSEYIHETANQIYKSKNKVFSVPISYELGHKSISTNFKITNATIGDWGTDIQKFTISSIEKSLIDINIGKIDKLIGIDVYTTQDDSFTFGAYAIKESMAYLMEQLNCPKEYEQSPDYPYNAAVIISSFYCKDFAADKLKVLALCDISLMFSNPAEVFIDFMEKIAKNQVSVRKPEDVYCYYYEKMGNEMLGGYKDLANTVKVCLKSYFNDNSFSHICNWIELVITTAIQMRESNKYWLLDIAQGGKLNKNVCFLNLLKKLGSPIIMNRQKEFYVYPSVDNGNREIGIFLAIRQIEELFYKGLIKCEMYNWCKSSDKNLIDERCCNSPWKKCHDKELCPYAVIWKHWNLEQYTPQKLK